MARKPLIAPGTLNAAGVQPLTLQQRIIANDAEKNGRPIPHFDKGEMGQDAETDKAADNDITGNTRRNITAHITAQEDSQTATRADSQPAARTPSKPDAVSTNPARDRAQELGSTNAIPITLRLPEGLNDYLDEQAHLHRKAKVLKQDLVRIAVQLLVEEIEGGADVTALLKGGR